MTGEIHMFLIWSNAMHKADDIIIQINKKFDILDIYLLNWSERHFSDNLSRFYGTNLPEGSFKEAHCGRGNFCVIVVHDPSPVYDICQTSGGKHRVNTNMFDAKQLFRTQTGGGHRIHATNTPAETAHDLMLLLETDSQTYLSRVGKPWNGKVKPVERDLPGADGWQSIEQLFRVLNVSISYLVLRNFDCLPHNYFVENHGDIDLLCSDIDNMRYLCNAKPVFNNPLRVLHKVKISGDEVLFDFRHIGDNYYDTEWEKDLLSRRELAQNCFYRPSERDHFYSLLYHAAIHKPQIGHDYIEKLSQLSVDWEGLSPHDFEDLGKIQSILDTFLNSNGYHYTEPHDLSVYLNNAIANIEKLSLGRILNTSKTIESALAQILNQSDNCATDSREFSKQIYKIHPLLKRHFTNRNYALLEHIPLKGIKNVLEIGADSGAVTRYLGENFENVLAVENSVELSNCVEARCKDLKNVRVFTDFESISKLKIQFDLIVFTNDCEKLFNQGINTKKLSRLITDTLETLNPEGTLLFTIDNPLSKTGFYSTGPAFNALDETSVDSLRSLYMDDVVSFIKAKGITDVELYYLYPNHISPRTIMNKAIEKHNFKAFGYWAASAFEHFDDKYINMYSAGEWSHAGRLGDMAGGVCIIAKKGGSPIPKVPWQVLSFSNSARPHKTQTITKLLSGKDLKIVKQGETIQAAPFIFDPNMRYPLFEGLQLDASLMHNVLSGSLDKINATLRQIVRFWLKSYEWTQNTYGLPQLFVPDDRDISGDALDAISRNLIISNGKIESFDDEWKSIAPIPMSYLLYRNAYSLFNNFKPETIVKKLLAKRKVSIKTRDDVILELINQSGIISPINRHHIKIFKQFEDRLQQFAATGELSKENPSLLEIYQMIKFNLAANDFEKTREDVALLSKYYHNLPEVQELLIRIQSTLNSEQCRAQGQVKGVSAVYN